MTTRRMVRLYFAVRLTLLFLFYAAEQCTFSMLKATSCGRAYNKVNLRRASLLKVIDYRNGGPGGEDAENIT